MFKRTVGIRVKMMVQYNTFIIVPKQNRRISSYMIATDLKVEIIVYTLFNQYFALFLEGNAQFCNMLSLAKKGSLFLRIKTTLSM